MPHHLTEPDFVLHYYGELPKDEAERMTRHLSECPGCRQELTRLQRVLGAIDDASLAPELPDHFERTVWARLEPNLRPERRGWFSWIASPAPLALAAAVIVLVGAAFFAGRFTSPVQGPSPTRQLSAEQMREGILLSDLGEHLDRSQMVLVELASAESDSFDLSNERVRAEHLLAANRLYRQTAASTGNTALGELLDELERFLVELAAGPEQLSAEDMNHLRSQIEANGLLFRVRIVSSKLRERQREAFQRRTGPQT